MSTKIECVGRSEAILERASQFAWIKNLQVGDVVRMPSGKLRIVRYVSHHGHSLGKTSVGFVIRHCSWTRRPYTILNGSDLASMGYRKTSARAKLNHQFDRDMEREMSSSGERILYCNGVCGIP